MVFWKRKKNEALKPAREDKFLESLEAALELGAMLDMRAIDVIEKMPELEGYGKPVRFLMNSDGVRMTVSPFERSVDYGDPDSWHYTVNLDTGEIINDTEESRKKALRMINEYDAHFPREKDE